MSRLTLRACLILSLAACATHRPVVLLPIADADQPHQGYVEADDGPHPSDAPDYFEWWYYDVTFEDGTSATLALYAREMFSRSGQAAVLINILDPSGDAHLSYVTRPRGEAVFGPRPGEVKVGAASTVRTDDGGLRIRASGVGNKGEALAADLTFRGTMPGFKPGDGSIRLDGRVALGWAVPMPRATVEGVLRVGDRERVVRGLGYHDHNWGEINLAETMGYWYWGRVTSPEVTVVYASIHFRERFQIPPIQFAVVGDDHHFLKRLELPVVPLQEEFLEAANRIVPRGVEMTSNDLHVRLSGTKILSADDLTMYVPWIVRPLVRLRTHPAYVRRLCDYEIDSTLEGLPHSVKGQAIAEFMYVWDE
jgi:hypothetical protein